VRKKLLIVVKSYPLPSNKYNELVCTAAVDEDGNFYRLYPINYRNMSYENWHKKYQWIEVDIERNQNDRRPESYRPVEDSIRPIGDPIPSADNWALRQEVVFGQGVQTMCSLQALG